MFVAQDIQIASAATPCYKKSDHMKKQCEMKLVKSAFNIVWFPFYFCYFSWQI